MTTPHMSRELRPDTVPALYLTLSNSPGVYMSARVQRWPCSSPFGRGEFSFVVSSVDE